MDGSFELMVYGSESSVHKPANVEPKPNWTNSVLDS